MPAGRPVKYTPEVIADIKDRLDKYVDETEIPIIVEFCYKNDIRKQRLYEIEELSDSIKRAMEKKEAQLQIMGLIRPQSATFVIFSLKQLGWRDNRNIEHSGPEGGPIEHKHKMDLKRLSIDELKQLERITDKLGTED